MPTYRGWSDDELERRADGLAAAVRRAWRAVAAALFTKLSAKTAVTVADANDVALAWAEQLEGPVLGYVARTFRDAASSVSEVAAAAGGEPELIGDDLVRHYLATARNRLRNVGDDVWLAVREQLIAGSVAGESPREIAQRVRGVAGVSPGHAATIARTEVHAAHEAGAYAQAAYLGEGVTKRWLATNDDRTRPTHRAMLKSDPVPVAEPFVVGGDPLRFPGDPEGEPGEVINCRCSVAYEFADAHATPTAADASTPELTTVTAGVAFDFDPGQRRDENGRWTRVGGVAADALKAIEKRLRRARSGNKAYRSVTSSDAFTTDDVRRAVGKYQVDAFRLNSDLRYGEDDKWEVTPGGNVVRGWPHVRDAFDDVFSRDTSRLKDDVTVKRGVVDPYRIWGDAWSNTGSNVGLTWRDPAYVSTTTDDAVARHFTGRAHRGAAIGEPVIMNILVPRGQHAISLGKNGAHPDYSWEREVLLPRGLVYRVVADRGTDRGGVRHIDVEVVPGGVTAAASPAGDGDESDDELSTGAEKLPERPRFVDEGPAVDVIEGSHGGKNYDKINHVTSDEAMSAGGDPLVAATWKPESHPRGKDGKFIKAGSVQSLLSTKKPLVGQVIDAVHALDEKQWHNLKPEQQDYVKKSVAKIPSGSKTHTELTQKLDKLGAHVETSEKTQKTVTPVGPVHDALTKTGFAFWDAVEKIDQKSWNETSAADRKKIYTKALDFKNDTDYESIDAVHTLEDLNAHFKPAPKLASKPTSVAKLPSTPTATPIKSAAVAIAAHKGAKPGSPAKVTTTLVWGKHPDNTVILETADGKGRVRWDGTSKKFSVDYWSDASGEWKTHDQYTKKDFYEKFKSQTFWKVPGVAKSFEETQKSPTPEVPEKIGVETPSVSHDQYVKSVINNAKLWTKTKDTWDAVPAEGKQDIKDELAGVSDDAKFGVDASAVLNQIDEWEYVPTLAPAEVSGPQVSVVGTPETVALSADEIWGALEFGNDGEVLAVTTANDGVTLRAVVWEAATGPRVRVQRQLPDGEWVNVGSSGSNAMFTKDWGSYDWKTPAATVTPTSAQQLSTSSLSNPDGTPNWSAIENEHHAGSFPDGTVIAVNTHPVDGPTWRLVVKNNELYFERMSTVSGKWNPAYQATGVGTTVDYKAKKAPLDSVGAPENWTVVTHDPQSPITTPSLGNPVEPEKPDEPLPTPPASGVSGADISGVTASHKAVFKQVLKSAGVGYWSKPEKIWDAVHAVQVMHPDPQNLGQSKFTPLQVLKALDSTLKTKESDPFVTKMTKWAATAKGSAYVGKSGGALTPTPSVSVKAPSPSPSSSSSLSSPSLPASPVADVFGSGDVSHLSATAKKQIYDAFKKQPSTYLSSPDQDIYAALKTISEDHGLSLLQGLRIIDEIGADKVKTTNQHLFEKKITDWLKTPAGAAVASGKPIPLPPTPKFAPGIDPDKNIKPFEETGHHDYKVISTTDANKLWSNIIAGDNGDWSAKEKSSLKTYTGGSYYSINSYLYGKLDKVSPTHANVIKNAQLGMRLSPTALLLHRGVGFSGIANAKTHADIEKAVGSTWKSGGFFSTSVGGHAAFSGNPVLLEVEAPPGTPLAWLKPISNYSSENEMLLAAGLHYKIISVKKSGGKSVVRVRVVPAPAEETQ